MSFGKRKSNKIRKENNAMSEKENLNARDLKLELCILRAIADIRNQHYDSAEKQLMDARKILENKEENNF